MKEQVVIQFDTDILLLYFVFGCLWITVVLYQKGSNTPIFSKVYLVSISFEALDLNLKGLFLQSK